MSRTLLCSTLSALLLASRAVSQSPATAEPTTFSIAAPAAEAYVGTLVPMRVAQQPGLTTPNTSSAATLTWGSSDPLVAWVTNEGVLVPLEPGKVRISARRGNQAASREIVVRENPVRRLSLAPSGDRIRVGEQITIQAVAADDRGRIISRIQPNFALLGEGGRVDSAGRFRADRAGSFIVIAELGGVSAMHLVDVVDSGVAQQGTASPDRLEIVVPRGQSYSGTTADLRVRATGGEIDSRAVTWRVSDASIARVGQDGLLTLLRPGKVKISAEVAGRRTEHSVRVLENPTADAALRVSDGDVRVGEQVHVAFDAWALGGRRVEDAKALFAVATARGSTRAATISEDGVFVAREPGVYTIVASAGARAAHQTVVVQPAQ
jgi:hypothetical protein